jgi:hypothetical protein
MVAEFMEFETPNEPQMGTVSSIQDKYHEYEYVLELPVHQKLS